MVVGSSSSHGMPLTAHPSCYVKMAWLKVRNMPKHHYTEAAARSLVSRFGKLWAIDAEKASVDYSSFDMLVKCCETETIPRELTLFYDELYRKVVHIEVELEIDVVSFDQLGFGTSDLPYEDMYNLALRGLRSDFVCGGVMDSA